jgi:AraC family ethanolamine operon transcriptional activator
MNNDSLSPMPAPKIFRYADVDHFRQSVRGLQVDFTPLARKISAEQTILNLRGVDVNLIKSFPRILDAQLAANCTAVGFTMDDGFPIRFNGVERDHSAIVIGRSGSAYTAVERTARQFTSIVFTPEIDDRGWPQAGPSFMIFETSASAHRRLRELILNIMSVSSNSSEGFDGNETALAMRESLLAAIDSAFADLVPTQWVSRANSVKQFKIVQDIQAALSSDVGNPIYSGELAKIVGVPVRTMHDAIWRYRNMSLHRYLRLRRLWLVRQRLLSGTASVKACALDFGFWHMSDFSRSYRFQFGESPSETLARSR